jgi:hypothetical protein
MPAAAHTCSRPCRGDVASPSRQVASGLRAGCRRDLRACAKKLPRRRAGLYHSPYISIVFFVCVDKVLEVLDRQVKTSFLYIKEL